MKRTDLHEWLQHPVSKELIEYLQKSKENIESAMFSGQCCEPFKYGQTVGMREVIDYILNYEFLEKEE